MQTPSNSTRSGIYAFLLLIIISAHANADDWSYRMQSGDNIWDLSHTLLKDWRNWKAVTKNNEISNDRRMRTGRIIQIPEEWLDQQPIAVTVSEVSGTVTAITGKDTRKIPVKNGMALFPGDKVITEEDSSISLHFADNSKLLLQANSELEIRQSRTIGKRIHDVEVELGRGRMESQVTPSESGQSNFRIKTDIAVTAVRGTEFRVGKTDRSTLQSEVTKGSVSVGNKLGAVVVKQGRGTVTKAGKPPGKPKMLLASPDLSASGVTQYYLPLTLHWGGVKGAASYRVQVAPNKLFDTLLVDKIRYKNDIAIANLPDGHYYLRVRAIDDTGLEGFDNVTSFDVAARPIAPLPQAPADHARLRMERIKYQWIIAPDAKEYRLEISQDKAFNRIIDSIATDQNQRQPVNGMEPGHYYWRLTSINAEGKAGPPGSASAIEVKAPPAVPEAEPAAISEDKVSFRWRGDPGARFEVQIAEEASFSKIVHQQETTGPKLEMDKPSPGSYHIRIRGFDDEGEPGDFSDPQQFEIPLPEWVPPSIIFSLMMILIL